MARLDRLLLLLVLYTLVATAAVHVFMHRHAFFEGWHHPGYAFEHMLDRSAERPFVYRALMPWAIVAIDESLPEGVRERYGPAARKVVDRYSRQRDPAYWTPTLERRYAIAFLLVSAFAVASLFAVRQLTAAVFPDAPLLHDAGPLAFGVALPLTMMNGGFMYDFPEAFFLFAATWLAWTRRTMLLAALLPIAVLNKETSALMVPILGAVLWHRLPRERRIPAIAAIAVPAATAVLALRHAYSGLPGTTMYDHLRDNVEFWSRPESWLSAMEVFVPLVPLPRGLNLVLLVPAVTMMLRGWGARPLSLRHFLVASAAVNIPLFFLFCNRDETRNLSLMYPAVYLSLCAGWLVASFDRAKRAELSQPATSS